MISAYLAAGQAPHLVPASPSSTASYASLWRESHRTNSGGMVSTEWMQGSSTWRIYCVPITTRGEGYQQIIYHKVRDTSGMDSPVSTFSRYCAY